jgi:hypothetical protein
MPLGKIKEGWVLMGLVGIGTTLFSCVVPAQRHIHSPAAGGSTARSSRGHGGHRRVGQSEVGEQPGCPLVDPPATVNLITSRTCLIASLSAGMEIRPLSICRKRRHRRHVRRGLVTRATSNRCSGRHHLGFVGDFARNQQLDKQKGVQRVQLPPGKGEPASRKRALHG